MRAGALREGALKRLLHNDPNLTKNVASVCCLQVCSYLCRTSAYLKDERLNWCLLWQAADGSQERRAATYCYETVAEVFPINSPVVYPPRT